MKHRTSDLEGALLDAAVAKAEGWDSQADEGFSPSITWAEGGPIIERERMRSSEYEAELYPGQRWHYWTPGNVFGHGPTALVAAMRAFVASKFGEEVELP